LGQAQCAFEHGNERAWAFISNIKSDACNRLTFASFTIPASSLAWHCRLRKVNFVSSEKSRANVWLLAPTIEAHASNVRPFAGSSLIAVVHRPVEFQEHFRRFRDSIEGG
tara:strand:- start:1793 stop:2122 length:330 start_codon:yes stop_codon:yes gene_type:complete